jgi:hypothetical protein
MRAAALADVLDMLLRELTRLGPMGVRAVRGREGFVPEQYAPLAVYPAAMTRSAQRRPVAAIAACSKPAAVAATL